MDALSRLIELVGLRARLDLRCQFPAGFDVDHEPAPPGELLFHLVLAGRCRLLMRDESVLEMQAGDFVALPRGSAHRVQSLEVLEVSGLGPKAGPVLVLDETGVLPLRHSVGLEPTELDLLCGRLVSASPLVGLLFAALPGALQVSLSGSAAPPRLLALAGLIRDEVAAERPGVLAIVASLANALFTLALRAQVEEGMGAPGLIRLLGDPRLGRAALAVLREPGRDWNTHALAVEATMSRASFMRHFAEAGEMTPGDFVALVRLNRAAVLLRQTRRGTADIGEEVGYASEAAFNRAFKKWVGVTPAVFRRGD